MKAMIIILSMVVIGCGVGERLEVDGKVISLSRKISGSDVRIKNFSERYVPELIKKIVQGKQEEVKKMFSFARFPLKYDPVSQFPIPVHIRRLYAYAVNIIIEDIFKDDTYHDGECVRSAIIQGEAKVVIEAYEEGKWPRLMLHIDTAKKKRYFFDFMENKGSYVLIGGDVRGLNLPYERSLKRNVPRELYDERD